MKTLPFSQPKADVDVHKVVGSTTQALTDALSVEEPLEIRLTADLEGCRTTRPVAVTMRTPGDDLELAAGFLFTEGIVAENDDIESIDAEGCNVVSVTLRPGVEIDPAIFERHSFVASSCGVCGKRSIAAVRVRRRYEATEAVPLLTPDIVHRLPGTLREAQIAFASTGGIHATGLFDASGNLLLVREDVGRHNALDKALGTMFLRGMLPLSAYIIMGELGLVSSLYRRRHTPAFLFWLRWAHRRAWPGGTRRSRVV